MTTQLGVSFAILAVTGAVGLVGWSLRRNVSSLDSGITALRETVTQVATDLRQLSATVSGHQASLAAGDVKLTDFERRLSGLEQRERERGCFGACRQPTSVHPPA